MKKKNNKKVKKITQKERECVNSKLFYIYDASNNIHEYTIIHTEWDNRDNEYELEYSNSAPWAESIRGTRALSILDHGNGFTFSRTIESEVDYSDALELKLLMNFIFNRDGNLSPEYHIQEVKDSPVKI
jgi:hypothetical protein